MIPELQQIGFTRNEANVYLAALKLGRCSVQQLAKATGLNRITVHSIAEKFENRQILTRTYEGKRRRLQVVDPEHLSMMLQREKQNVQERQNVLENIFPSLSELYRRSERGMKITTYEGEKGYVAMCNDILDSGTRFTLEYANIDALNEIIEPYVLKDYLPRKRRLKIHTQFLYVDTPYARRYIQKEYIDYAAPAPAEVKFISQEEFPMESFYVIYDNKVMIFTPSTVQGVLIEDATIANSLRPFFKFVWQRAGEAVTNL